MDPAQTTVSSLLDWHERALSGVSGFSEHSERPEQNLLHRIDNTQTYEDMAAIGAESELPPGHEALQPSLTDPASNGVLKP